jgi:hypothetical protein
VSATIIYDNHATTQVAKASAEGDNLWLAPEDLAAATGWELKPQGVCRDETCVPIPAGRSPEFVRSDGCFNLAALARQIGQPYAVDERHAVWSFARTPEVIGGQLRSLEAPDFTLPDLAGKLHSLSDHRGRKVLLMSWASW